MNPTMKGVFWMNRISAAIRTLLVSIVLSGLVYGAADNTQTNNSL